MNDYEYRNRDTDELLFVWAYSEEEAMQRLPFGDWYLERVEYPEWENIWE